VSSSSRRSSVSAIPGHVRDDSLSGAGSFTLDDVKKSVSQNSLDWLGGGFLFFFFVTCLRDFTSLDPTSRSHVLLFRWRVTKPQDLHNERKGRRPFKICVSPRLFNQRGEHEKNTLPLCCHTFIFFFPLPIPVHS